MSRPKRSLAKEEITPITLHLRSSVHDKLVALAGPSGSKVATVEAITEYIFARRIRKKVRLLTQSK